MPTLLVLHINDKVKGFDVRLHVRDDYCKQLPSRTKVHAPPPPPPPPKKKKKIKFHILGG